MKHRLLLSSALFFSLASSSAYAQESLDMKDLLLLQAAQGYGCGVLFSEFKGKEQDLLKYGMPQDKFEKCLSYKKLWDSVPSESESRN